MSARDSRAANRNARDELLREMREGTGAAERQSMIIHEVCRMAVGDYVTITLKNREVIDGTVIKKEYNPNYPNYVPGGHHYDCTEDYDITIESIDGKIYELTHEFRDKILNITYPPSSYQSSSYPMSNYQIYHQNKTRNAGGGFTKRTFRKKGKKRNTRRNRKTRR